MLKISLAYLGQMLANKFDLEPGRSLFYEDKEHIMSRLSDQSLPLELPLLSYFMTDMNPITNRKIQNFPIIGNLNNTIGKRVYFLPINISVAIGIFAKTPADYFDFISSYFNIVRSATFEIKFAFDSQNEVKFDLSIVDVQSLTTPPVGYESRYYDTKGEYYMLDGTFTFSTFLAYSEENKLIRRISCPIKIDSFLYGPPADQPDADSSVSG